jgi:mRNA interferase RelE/StbE
MYSIEFTKQAIKALERMPRNVAVTIKSKISHVAAAPNDAHNNVTRLQGRPEFRLRVGDWRVIYRLVDERLVLLVIKIGGRGDVYDE